MDVSLVPTVARDVQVVLPGYITAGLVANQIADSTAYARYIEAKATNITRRQVVGILAAEQESQRRYGG